MAVESMVSAIYHGPRVLQFAIPATLAIWILLSVYLVLFTDIPLECGVLLVVPIVLLVWEASVLAGGVRWEVDASGYSMRRGDRVTELVPWGDIQSLVAVRTSSRSSTVVMSLVDKAGRTRAKLVSSYTMGVEDIRNLYEAAAYYLRDFGVTERNNLGWHPNLSVSGTKEVRGELPSFLPHFAFSLFVAGLIILAAGSFEGVGAPISFGVGLILVATTLFAASRIRSRQRTSHIDKRSS